MKRVRSEATQRTDAAYRAMHREEAKIRTRAWVKAHPEQRKAIDKAYREKNKDKIRAVKKAGCAANREKHNAANARWKINRRIKLCDFDALLLAQGGKCAICCRDNTGRKDSKRLCVDHCHVTGKVRGLLCHKCNSMLGHAQDNTATLLRAIHYLEGKLCHAQ